MLHCIIVQSLGAEMIRLRKSIKINSMNGKLQFKITNF